MAQEIRSPIQNAGMLTSRAIVATEPEPVHKPGQNWHMQDIMVPTRLGDGEVLVEMVASGICHTDIALTGPGKNQTFPIIAGHEGKFRARSGRFQLQVEQSPT